MSAFLLEHYVSLCVQGWICFTLILAVWKDKR